MKITDYGIAGDAVSRSFRLSLGGQSIQVVETPALDGAERERLAAVYRKLPDYCHIYDPAGMHLHYAHAAAEGEAEVRVEVSEDIQSFRIHPLRKEIRGRANGRTLAFSTGNKDPRNFIVRINGLPPLMVIVEDPERDRFDGPVIEAGAFLTDRTGVIDQTEGFQRGLAKAGGSGGTLVVPPGTYLATQLHVKGGRGFGLHLAPGCLIRIKPSARGENEHRHGLWLEDCEDVAVTGRGCIDHQAYEHYALGGNNYQDGMVDYYTANASCPWVTQSPLFITGSRRIRVDGLTIRNGRNFNVNCRNCDDLTLSRIKILTPAACTPEYADGINTGSCRNVLVENCLVASNDDCFASGHYFSTYDSRPSRDHVVRGVLGWSMRGSGARLGFHADRDQGDFTFEDCDFVAMTYSSFLVHPLRAGKGGKPSRYGEIRAINCAFDDAQRLESLLDVQGAGIEKLEVVNLAFHGEPKPGASVIVESDPENPIGEVRLKNLSVDGWPLAKERFRGAVPGSPASRNGRQGSRRGGSA